MRFVLGMSADAPASHVDTARMYRNEKFVGECIRESGIPRSEIFVSASSAGAPLLLRRNQR